MLKIKLRDFSFRPLHGRESYKIQLPSVKFSPDGKFRYAVAENGTWTKSFHTGWETISTVEQWDFTSQIDFWFKGNPSDKPFFGEFYLQKDDDEVYIVFPNGFGWRVRDGGRPHRPTWGEPIVVDGANGMLAFTHKGHTVYADPVTYSWDSLKTPERLL